MRRAVEEEDYELAGELRNEMAAIRARVRRCLPVQSVIFRLEVRETFSVMVLILGDVATNAQNDKGAL